MVESKKSQPEGFGDVDSETTTRVMDARHREVRRLFLDVLEAPSDERSALLDRVAGEDPELRREVEELLGAYQGEDTSSARLDQLERALEPSASPLEDLPEIEHYSIHTLLGAGGMGTVYEAEQLHPVRRAVAIKLIKRGLDTRQVVARFQAERQALARMSHPNIARVFDAGESRDGRPFFAMELVHGQPITRHSDRRRLPVEERLRLFITVCGAVQHAHQKGIIHRDLKPSNVLVERVDGEVNVKVIDFGIAKTLQPEPGEAAHTAIGQFLGTPGYTSPEQADPTEQGIDTRTDVYALGVLLYELLTGSLPTRGTEETQDRRSVSDTATERPSERVSTLGERQAQIAAERHTDPGGLVRALRGDLDWICLRAIDPDRERRYPSASELAADIERHLRREPVLARPPSVRYRLGRFARRHRLLVAAAATVLLALTLGLGAAGVGLVRARSAEAEARHQARTAGEVSRFLIEIFRSSDPYRRDGRELTARELLERAAERIDDDLHEDPETRAALLHALGEAHDSLALFDQAQPLLERALAILRDELGPDHPRTARAALTLAWHYRNRGRPQEAEQLLTRAIDVLDREGDEHRAAAAQGHETLGVVLRDRGELDAAQHHLERSLELRRLDATPNPEAVGRSLYHLAWLENLGGRYREAEEVYHRTLALLEAQLGSRHPLVAWCYNDLGTVLWNQGRLEEASQHLKTAIEIHEASLGPEHPALAAPLQNLGGLLAQLGREAEALELLGRVVLLREATQGSEHPELAQALSALSDAERQTGDLVAAREHMERATEIARRALGPASADYGWYRARLGGVIAAEGDVERGRRIVEEGLTIREGVLGPDHPSLAPILLDLLAIAEETTDQPRALELGERILEIRRSASGSPLTLARSWCRVADLRDQAGDAEGARAALARATELLDERRGEPGSEGPASCEQLLSGD